MHFVHAFTRRADPSTTARTRWMFGSHRRFPRLCENETVLPNRGRLPQMSHTAAMTVNDGSSRDRGVLSAGFG